jgi:CheY-like chemotaxis protein
LARKILLADDSVTAQNMGRKILTDAGYEVVTVNNGSAALKKISEHKPDLIVLDVYMPGYSGLEVCQRIKEKAETARIPVLLTVGKLEPFKPEEARRARADAFVVKPFEASELLAALTKLEDKVIPQPEPYKQGRFAKAVASFERDTEGDRVKDSDEGWKARLRIPTTPKSREPEPEADYSATQGKGFRDFVDAPGKKNQPSAAGSEREVERPMPAGLPHDITPEEIAAITAAAAQLNGTGVAVQNSVVEAPFEEKVEPTPETKAETVEVVAEESAPVTFASAPEVAEPTQTTVAETAVEPAVPEVSNETAPAGDESPVAQDSSPQTVEEEPKTHEDFAVVATPQAFPEETVAEVPATSVSPSAEAPPAETVAPWPGGPSDGPVPTAVEPVAPAGDDEVMAALQSLIPSTTSSLEPTNGQPKEDLPAGGFAAAVAAADSVSGLAHAAGPRWIAEEVALASEEGATSLEQEMEKAYAAVNPELAPVAAVEASVEEKSLTTQSLVAENVATDSAYAMASAAGMGEVSIPWGGLHTPVQGPPVVESASVEASVMPVTPVEETIDAAVLQTAAVPSTEGAVASVEGEAHAIPDASIENEIVGGTEDMAANWKNIRDSIAGAATKPALAKEEFQQAEPAPSEPVTEAPERPSTSLSAADPKAIASIVDSVLAELRPRIVEEIARKLADPKKD